MRIFLSKAIKFFTGLLLLPLLPSIVTGIWEQATGWNERTLWMANPLSLCLGGLILWGVFALLFSLPPRIYVLAHELTHALFAKMCGGRIKEISVKHDRGHILTDRSNFLIVLAPYLFPFYAVIWGFLGALASLLFPFSKFQNPFWVGIGICLGYHVTMTAKMMTTHQSDFTSQGYFFSFVLIMTVNLALLLLLFLLLPNPEGFLDRVLCFSTSALRFYQKAFAFLSS